MPDILNDSPSVTSVIMVSFHTGDILFRAIDSILAQTMPVELIVVDNGNPETVIRRLEAYEAQDARIKLLTGHGNIGFSRGNNLGVAKSTGSHLLMLNPDSVSHPDTLEKFLVHAATLVSPFMIGARIINLDGSDQRGSRRTLLTPTTAFIEALHLQKFFPRLRLNLHQEQVPTSLSPIPAISGACMFLPRRDFLAVGGFDEGYFLHVEDLDLCFRFRKQGGEIYFAPDIAITHIGSTSEATSDFVERHKTHGFIRYFHQNFAADYPKPFLWALDIAIWARYLLRQR